MLAVLLYDSDTTELSYMLRTPGRKFNKIMKIKNRFVFSFSLIVVYAVVLFV